MKKTIATILVLTAILTLFAACGGKGNQYIEEAKKSVYYGASTYGAMLDGYCTNTKWTYFKSNSYQDVVQFTGDSPQGRVVVQFVKGYGWAGGGDDWKQVEQWQNWYVEVNGKELAILSDDPYSTAARFFDSILDSVKK